MTHDASPDGPLLSPSDVDTLHVVADDLRAFPDRRNVMAARVSEDLSRLAVAAEAGGEELRTTMQRWPFDDALGFLDYAIVVAQHRGTPAQVAQRTAARAILRRLLRLRGLGLAQRGDVVGRRGAAGRGAVASEPADEGSKPTTALQRIACQDSFSNRSRRPPRQIMKWFGKAGTDSPDSTW